MTPADRSTIMFRDQFLTVVEAGHADDAGGPLYRPVENPVSGNLMKPLSPTAVYCHVVKHYARKAGFDAPGFCTYALRATAATNALDQQANIGRLQ